jgi:hypothetical protein
MLSAGLLGCPAEYRLKDIGPVAPCHRFELCRVERVATG